MISLSLMEREFDNYVTIRRLNQWHFSLNKAKVITYHFISYRRKSVLNLVEIQYEGILNFIRVSHFFKFNSQRLMITRLHIFVRTHDTIYD